MAALLEDAELELRCLCYVACPDEHALMYIYLQEGAAGVDAQRVGAPESRHCVSAEPTLALRLYAARTQRKYVGDCMIPGATGRDAECANWQS